MSNNNVSSSEKVWYSPRIQAQIYYIDCEWVSSLLSYSFMKGFHKIIWMCLSSILGLFSATPFRHGWRRWVSLLFSLSLIYRTWIFINLNSVVTLPMQQWDSLSWVHRSSLVQPTQLQLYWISKINGVELLSNQLVKNLR